MQAINLQRVAFDEDCQWRESFLFSAKVRPYAGTNQVTNAGRYRCESG